MLGILTGLVGLGILGYGAIHDGNIDANERAKAKARGETEYFTHDGHCQDVNNNHRIYTSHLPGEDHIRYDLKTGEKRNLSAEKYAKVTTGSTIRLGDDNHDTENPYGGCIGVRYKDRATGDIYVMRSLTYPISFYFSITQKKPIRFIDDIDEIYKPRLDEEWQSILRQYEWVKDRDPYMNCCKNNFIGPNKR